MNNKSYELIVFDWDGTLMDSVAKIVECFTAASEDLGMDDPGDEAIRNIIGLGMQEAIDDLFPGIDPDVQQSFIEQYRHHFLHKNDTAMPLFAGVREGLQQLVDHGYQLGVATGKARRGLNRVLQETGLHAFFSATRCADEAYSKPHPQMLQDVVDDVGIGVELAIMVGDTVYDMQMAQNAGTDALAVSYGVHERYRLLRCQPKGCLDSFTEVCRWFVGAR